MSDDVLQIQRNRLQAIIDVVSMAAVNEPDPVNHQIKIQNEDELGFLEETINLFIRELAETLRQKSESVQATQRAQAELEEKLATIERQRAAIRDLSTPIIELWDDILTLPVVGVVDTRRAVEMTERLLSRIAQGKARCVIIDITGVDVVDTSTADHFVKMTSAARLLGAYCVVTGISPVVAQTLVQVGVEFTQVRTLRNLKDGLRDCFAYLRSLKAGETAARSADGQKSAAAAKREG